MFGVCCRDGRRSFSLHLGGKGQMLVHIYMFQYFSPRHGCACGPGMELSHVDRIHGLGRYSSLINAERACHPRAHVQQLGNRVYFR